MTVAFNLKNLKRRLTLGVPTTSWESGSKENVEKEN